MAKLKLLGLSLRNFLKGPATVEYPRVPAPVEPDYRGRHYADLRKCTGCSVCAIECPANAIEMVEVPSGYEVPASNRRRVYPLIDYGKCVFCYRCVAVCPFSAYVVSNEYKLAGPEKPDSGPLSLDTLSRVGGG